MFGELLVVGVVLTTYLFLRNPRKKYNTYGSHYATQTEYGEIPTLSTRAEIKISHKEGELTFSKDKDKYTVPIFKPSYLGLENVIVTFSLDDVAERFEIKNDDYVDIITLHEKWKNNLEEARKTLPPLEILEE